MELINNIVDVILHLDTHLAEMISIYGSVTYVILFAIIFIETGFVIAPFLPGDSLLFLAGAFAAIGSLNLLSIVFVLSAAAIAGDTANYWIGRFFGRKIEDSNAMVRNRRYLEQTRQFFEKHGGKAVVLARFVPIIRTFAPFVAGAAKMQYSRFLVFNISGGILWVTVFTLLGYFFGNIEFIKSNLTFLVAGIVMLSVLPIVFAAWRNKEAKIERLPKAE